MSMNTAVLTCTHCSHQIPLVNHLCPNCFSYQGDEAGTCPDCGEPLNIVCKQCGIVNWSGSHICIGCGFEVDRASSVISSAYGTTAERLSKQMENAKELKEKEEVASSNRMAEMMAAEESRQEAIRQRIKKQKEQERMLLVIMFGAVSLFLLGLIIYAIISSVG